MCVFYWPYMRCLEGFRTVCVNMHEMSRDVCFCWFRVCEVAAIGGVESKARDAASSGGG